MKNKTKNKSYIRIILIGIIILGTIIWAVTRDNSNLSSDSAMDTFSKCLTEKGAIMYGTFWCPHCAKTKKLFGNSFSYINYIECDPRGDNEQSMLCISKNIDKYDTWEFSDGTRLISEPTLEQFSQKTGCVIPQ